MKEFGDRPEFQTKLVRYRNNVAILQRALGSLSESEATLRATLDLLAPSIDGPDPLPAPRWQVARVSNNLGSLLLRKRTDEAGTHLHRAEGLLRKLTREFPSVAQYSLELASVEYNLGTLAADAKHFEQTVESYQESVRLLEALARRFPGSPAYRMKLCFPRSALAKALGETTPTEAEKSLRKVLDEQSALLKEYPEVPEYQIDVGRGHFQLGLLLMKTNPAAAIPEAETARSFHRDVLKTRPESEQVLAFLLEDQLLLAQALIAAGACQKQWTPPKTFPRFIPANHAFISMPQLF